MLDNEHDKSPHPLGVDDIFLFSDTFDDIPCDLLRLSSEKWRQIKTTRHFSIYESRFDGEHLYAFAGKPVS